MSWLTITKYIHKLNSALLFLGSLYVNTNSLSIHELIERRYGGNALPKSYLRKYLHSLIILHYIPSSPILLVLPPTTVTSPLQWVCAHGEHVHSGVHAGRTWYHYSAMPQVDMNPTEHLSFSKNFSKSVLCSERCRLAQFWEPHAGFSLEAKLVDNSRSVLIVSLFKCSHIYIQPISRHLLKAVPIVILAWH